MFQPIYHLRFHGGPFDGVAQTSVEFTPTNKLQLPSTPRLAESDAACQGRLVEPWCAAYRLVHKDHDLEDGRPAITLRYQFLAYEMVEMPHESTRAGSLLKRLLVGLGRWLMTPIEYPLQSSRWTSAAPLPQAVPATPAALHNDQREIGPAAGQKQADAPVTTARRGLQRPLGDNRCGRLPRQAR